MCRITVGRCPDADVVRVASSLPMMMMASSAESRQGFGSRLFPTCSIGFFFLRPHHRGVGAALCLGGGDDR